MPTDARHIPIEKHPFEPFLPANARILFLGSFPPQPHRWCMPFYYPNWINDFWRIMGLIHFGDKDHFCLPAEKRFNEPLIRQFCIDTGLAFYDTACAVRRLRSNASDAFLEVVTPTDLPSLLSRIPECHTIVTTGQKATEVLSSLFGCPLPPVGGHIDLNLHPTPTSPSTYPTPSDLLATPTPLVPSTIVTPSEPSTVASPPVLSTAPDKPLRFYRMPSTSRAYPLPLEKKAESYRQLFQHPLPAAKTPPN